MMSIVNFLGQPEGKAFEYKRDLSSLKPLLKTLVAFATPACGQVVIEYTVPEKPNSRLQKYKLTDEGKRVMEATK